MHFFVKLAIFRQVLAEKCKDTISPPRWEFWPSAAHCPTLKRPVQIFLEDTNLFDDEEKTTDMVNMIMEHARTQYKSYYNIELTWFIHKTPLELNRPYNLSKRLDRFYSQASTYEEKYEEYESGMLGIHFGHSDSTSTAAVAFYFSPYIVIELPKLFAGTHEPDYAEDIASTLVHELSHNSGAVHDDDNELPHCPNDGCPNYLMATYRRENDKTIVSQATMESIISDTIRRFSVDEDCNLKPLDYIQMYENTRKDEHAYSCGGIRHTITKKRLFKINF